MKIQLSKTILIACLILIISNSTFAAGWGFKREITINNIGPTAANAVIRVQLSGSDFDFAKAKPDGADVRFSATKSLKGDGLSYWIEKWNDNGLTTLWLKVPSLKAGKTSVFIFYDNETAPAVSNGDATFLFFDDFESGDFSKKWTNTSIGEVAEKDGYLKLKETDGQDGIITANFEVTGKMIIRTVYQRGNGDEHWTRGGIGGWNNFFCYGDHTDFAGTGTNYLAFYDAGSLSSLKTAPLIKVGNGKINDKWRPVAFWYDGTNLKGMQDDVTVSWPSANTPSKLSLRTLDNDAWDNYTHISVSAFLDGEQDVAVGAEQKN